MSGGFETVYSTAIIALGVLSRSKGQQMQQQAYEEITNVYESEEKAFDIERGEVSLRGGPGQRSIALLSPVEDIASPSDLQGIRVPRSNHPQGCPDLHELPSDTTTSVQAYKRLHGRTILTVSQINPSTAQTLTSSVRNVGSKKIVRSHHLTTSHSGLAFVCAPQSTSPTACCTQRSAASSCPSKSRKARPCLPTLTTSITNKTQQIRMRSPQSSRSGCQPGTKLRWRIVSSGLRRLQLQPPMAFRTRH